MNNDINKKILEKVKLKLAISTFDERENVNMVINKKSFFKTAAVACCAMVLTSGLVFATDMGEYLKNIFWPNASEGVTTAVMNGYVSNVETEYQDSNGIAIKVDTVLMDDFNFIMDLNVKLDEKYDIKEFENMYLQDLRVVDETGKVVFVTHEAEDWQSYRGAHSSTIDVKSENELVMTFIASGNPDAFPKSKKLAVSFSKIKIKRSVEEKVYKGNWNFEIEIPEEFINRETVNYNLKKCNDKNTTFSKAVLSNTGFKIALSTSTDKIDYEVIHSPQGDRTIFKEVYVKTSDGKMFGPTGRTDGDGSLSLSSDNVIDYTQTFNLTKYDATDKVTVVLVTNMDEKIEIVLEK